MEDGLDQLADALVKFQSKVPVIPKNQTAIVKGKTKDGREYDRSYKYADLADIWEAIRTPLSEAGLAVTQFLVGNTAIRTRIWHTSGQIVDEMWDIPTGGKTPQEVGSVITYYKRYALGAALGISIEEDDDGKAGNKKPEPATSNEPSDDQWDLLHSLARQLKWSTEMARKNFANVKTPTQAASMVEQMRARLPKDNGDERGPEPIEPHDPIEVEGV